MKRDLVLEATIVEKYAAVSSVIDERARRLWAGAESRAIGYGGDAVVSAATGLARQTIRKGRSEIESGTNASTPRALSSHGPKWKPSRSIKTNSGVNGITSYVHEVDNLISITLLSPRMNNSTRSCGWSRL